MIAPPVHHGHLPQDDPERHGLRLTSSAGVDAAYPVSGQRPFEASG
jgi:hypothetical protein